MQFVKEFKYFKDENACVKTIMFPLKATLEESEPERSMTPESDSFRN